MREPEAWRRKTANQLRVPLWTVDADVIVPSKLLEKAQYAAHIIRPRLQTHLKTLLVAPRNPAVHAAWSKSRALQLLEPAFDITHNWQLDRSVAPVSKRRGGRQEAHRLLKLFVEHKLRGYGVQRNKPENDRTSRLSPYLHFGHISPITVALAVEKADAPKADREAFFEPDHHVARTLRQPSSIPSGLRQLRMRRTMGPSHPCQARR